MQLALGPTDHFPRPTPQIRHCTTLTSDFLSTQIVFRPRPGLGATPDSSSISSHQQALPPPPPPPFHPHSRPHPPPTFTRSSSNSTSVLCRHNSHRHAGYVYSTVSIHGFVIKCTSRLWRYSMYNLSTERLYILYMLVIQVILRDS